MFVSFHWNLIKLPLFIVFFLFTFLLWKEGRKGTENRKEPHSGSHDLDFIHPLRLFSNEWKKKRKRKKKKQIRNPIRSSFYYLWFISSMKKERKTQDILEFNTKLSFISPLFIQQRRSKRKDRKGIKGKEEKEKEIRDCKHILHKNTEFHTV